MRILMIVCMLLLLPFTIVAVVLDLFQSIVFEHEPPILVLPDPSAVRELTDECPKTLTLWTYNVGMLPDYISQLNHLRPCKTRMMEIIDMIEAQTHHPDIICFQEMFDPDIIQLTMEYLRYRYPYMIARVGQPRYVGFHAGLMVISRLPITSHSFTIFTDSGGVDYCANKGLLRTTIQINKKDSIHVYSTHLQSDFVDSDFDIRKCQLYQIDKIIRHEQQFLGPSPRATFFVGDLNLTTTEFKQMKPWFSRRFIDVNPQEYKGTFYDVENQHWGTPRWRENAEIEQNSHLDYQFIVRPLDWKDSACIKYRTQDIQLFTSKQHNSCSPSSDHLPVGIIYSLS